MSGLLIDFSTRAKVKRYNPQFSTEYHRGKLRWSILWEWHRKWIFPREPEIEFWWLSYQHSYLEQGGNSTLRKLIEQQLAHSWGLRTLVSLNTQQSPMRKEARCAALSLYFYKPTSLKILRNALKMMCRTQPPEPLILLCFIHPAQIPSPSQEVDHRHFPPPLDLIEIRLQ